MVACGDINGHRRLRENGTFGNGEPFQVAVAVMCVEFVCREEAPCSVGTAKQQPVQNPKGDPQAAKRLLRDLKTLHLFQLKV
jgi:hypothetical protein